MKKIIQYEIYRDDTFIEWGEVIYSKYIEERDKESDKRYIEAKKKVYSWMNFLNIKIGKK